MIVWELGNGRLDATFAGSLLVSAGADVYAASSKHDGFWSRLAPFLANGKSELHAQPASETAELPMRIPPPDCVLVGVDDLDGVPEWLRLGNRYRAAVVFFSDFGIFGPYSGRPASELTLIHLGGIGYFIPGQVNDLARDRPLGLPRDSVSYITGLVGAGAALAELYPRAVHGVGSPVMLDVSTHEVVASFTFGNIASVTYDNAEPSRGADARPAGWAVALLKCKDGYVCLVTLENRQWKNWLQVLGNPDWGEFPLFSDRNERSRNWDALQPLIEAITMKIPAAELATRAQALRVPCTAVASVKQLLTDSQLISRSFFQPSPSPDGSDIVFPNLSQIWRGTTAEAVLR